MISWWTWDRVLRTLVVGLTLATLGGFFGDQAWWLDVVADFKWQAFIAAAVLLLAAAATRRKAMALVSLLLLAANGVAVAPYLGQTGDGPAAIKLLSYNVYNLNTEPAKPLEFIRRENADIVVLTELNAVWQNALITISDVYPHQFFGPPFTGPGDKPHRIGILSKRPWAETGIAWSDFSSRAFAIWARFPPSSSAMTVVAAHVLNPVVRPPTHQMAELGKLSTLIQGFDGPVMVVGDFNMTPFSTRYQSFLQGAGLRRADGGINASWPSYLSALGLSLDHIFISGKVGRATMRTGPRLGSDHLPILGSFDLKK